MVCLLALALTRAGSSQTAGAGAAASPFERLHFREIGPATPAGRVTDFAVAAGNLKLFYVATPSAGLWKTVNAGATFETVFEDQRVSSIGAVAIAPSDSNVVWVGTGETSNRQNSSWGDGVYRSGDGGKTWRNTGLRESKHVARIVIDPANPDVAYVAALGNLWAAGGERGVYKTSDGGRTWTPVLAIDADTGAVDLVMDPSDARVLYAATYQRRRATWGFNGGGPGSGIHKTTDRGLTWTRLTNGLPEGPLGRIGLDVYRKNPRVVYARIEHPREGGIYRSDDAGDSWKKMSALNPEIPAYFSQIRIDPRDDNRIYVLNVTLRVSDDGGRTFSDNGAQRIHPDLHAMWIDPEDPAHLMIGGDGGVGVSRDRSRSYFFLGNMPIGQVYHVAFDTRDPYSVCGGLQDSYTWCGPSATRSVFGIVNDDWTIVSGGDGFAVQVDPRDPNTLYAEQQNGEVYRVDRATNERKLIRPDAPAGEPPYRWNWDTPIQLSPHDPAVLFVAANKVLRSDDRGQSFRAISPDLTSNVDRESLSLMGVVAKDFSLAKHYGVRSYPTLVTFAESPKRAGLYWAGSDDGLVHVSGDSGATWTNVTARIPGLPERMYVSELVPSRFAEGTVYATFDGHRLGDFGAYVYASTDMGGTWKPIAAGLPSGTVARTIAEDLRNPQVLYLGTEAGLYVTLDRGGGWMRVRANLPTVPIYDIAVHPRDNDMIVATHGRGIWVFDDLTPFQELAQADRAEAHLFSAPAATQRVLSNNDRNKWFEGNAVFLGENPPSGATLSYRLKRAAKELVIAIQDREGNVVRRLTAPSEDTGAGVNRLVWDLRVEPLAADASLLAGSGNWDGARTGPLVLPGEYRATLQVDGADAGSVAVTVKGDPDVRVSDDDRRTHFETLMELHRLQADANAAAKAVAALQDDVHSLRASSDGNASVSAEAKSRLAGVEKELEPLRRRLGVAGIGGAENARGRIGALKVQILASTSPPTETQTRAIAEARGQLQKAIAESAALAARMAQLHKELGPQTE
jgi:photosystem II stability/assembly factor-like uncharacterized protein